MKNNSMVVTIVVALIVGGAAFFGGVKYQQNQKAANTNLFGGAGSRSGSPAGARRFGGGQVLGDIINQDDKSITVKLADGSSKIVLFSATTNVNKAAVATKSDLTTGSRVAVFGTTNTDGSVTAQNIQLNPIQRERPSGTPDQ